MPGLHFTNKQPCNTSPARPTAGFHREVLSSAPPAKNTAFKRQTPVNHPPTWHTQCPYPPQRSGLSCKKSKRRKPRGTATRPRRMRPFKKKEKETSSICGGGGGVGSRVCKKVTPRNKHHTRLGPSLGKAETLKQVSKPHPRCVYASPPQRKTRPISNHPHRPNRQRGKQHHPGLLYKNINIAKVPNSRSNKPNHRHPDPKHRPDLLPPQYE